MRKRAYSTVLAGARIIIVNYRAVLRLVLVPKQTHPPLYWPCQRNARISSVLSSHPAWHVLVRSIRGVAGPLWFANPLHDGLIVMLLLCYCECGMQKAALVYMLCGSAR
eukprot:6190797-Pleurochrysis_carterae.AAC.4